METLVPAPYASNTIVVSCGTSLFFFYRKSQGKLLLMFVATSVFLNELNVQKENSEPSKCLLSKAK